MIINKYKKFLVSVTPKYLALALCGTMLFSSVTIEKAFAAPVNSSATAVTTVNQNTLQQEVRGIWISYFELEAILKNKSESSFRAAYATMLNNLSKDGFNTVYVQVRPFGDALYQSQTVPSSYMISGTEGAKLAFDPLKVMIEASKLKNIKIEAWLNPYRVRIPYVKASISKANIASKWLTDGSNRAVKLSNGTFFNPSDTSVNQMFIDEVKYIVENYSVDGIHLDDYFYPTTAQSFDKPQYDAYVKAGGKLKLADFRRSRINDMVKGVYQVCKSAKNPVRFGISPQGLQKNNYDGQFADVEKWVKEEGYVDYICPQIYYGYQNQTAPFKTVLGQWQQLASQSKVDFYIGLAPYKIGLVDKYAHSGSGEWQLSSGLLQQMILDSRLINNYKGVILFRYDSLYKPSKAVEAAVKAEKELMVALWQNEQAKQR